MKHAILFLLSILICFGSDTTLNSTPKKKDAFNLSEILSIIDSDEGFYERAFAAISPDGKIVVADAGNKQIHIYSEAGKKIRSFGQEGSGPGEFRQIFNIGALSDAVVIRDEIKLSFFSYEGRFTKDISLVASGSVGSPVFLKNSVLVYYESGKHVYQVFNEKGEELKSVLRKGYKETGDNGRMMIKIGMRRPIPFKNGFVMEDKSLYKITHYNKDLEEQETISRHFTRVERDLEALEKKINIDIENNMSKSERGKMIAKIRQDIINRMGKYETDIQGILGEIEDCLVVSTATGKENVLSLDIIKDNQLYTQKTLEFEDHIQQSRIDNGTLILSFKNEEKGPYIKLFKISVL